MAQELFHGTQYFKKKLPMRHPMPYFFVDFNGGYTEYQSYVSFNMSFMAGNVFIPGVESLHFISE